MASLKPVEWVSSLIMRFEEQLPCRTGPQSSHARLNMEQNKNCLIYISRYRFSLVISGLTKILQKVNETFVAVLSSQKPHGADFEKNYYESLLIVLDTLEKCLSGQAKDTTRFDEAMNVKLLLREVCQFIDLPAENPMVVQLRNLASRVLFALSINNFNAVFNRVSARLQELSATNEENPDYADIELIQHINLDLQRLNKLLIEIVQKFRLLRKGAHLVLMISLEKAIWNWMGTYPNEFDELQKKPCDDLAKSCEALFEQLDNFAENNKRRVAVWPLQIMLLVLSPKILEEIVNADSGAPCSPRHSKKRQFIDSLKKALLPHSSSKQLTEAAAVASVKLCKVSTYINILDRNNVVFSLVQAVFNDLKLLLFNPLKPFSRGQNYAGQDVELMIDCFVSCFRINPHNNEPLKVCLNPNSPPAYHFVLVSSLHRIITQPRLPWWPQIDIVYNKSSEMRSMFTETLNKVTQVCITHTPLKMIQVRRGLNFVKHFPAFEVYFVNCYHRCLISSDCY